MKKKYEAVATTGEYQKDGEKKKLYSRIGNVFEGDDGRLTLKLDTIPVGPYWSGWVSLQEPKPYDTPYKSDSQRRHNEDKGNGYAPRDNRQAKEEGDIPF